MKRYFLAVTLAFAPLIAGACDENIRQFARDCAIQDKFTDLRARFAAKGIDINEVAEYRVIRFVDRSSWDRAIEHRVKPRDIYKPAPATWMVWDSGIREVLSLGGQKGALLNGYSLDRDAISTINLNVLERDGMNVKDAITNQKLRPGQYRGEMDNGVGFAGGSRNYKNEIAESELSMDRFQQKWESAVGKTFEQILMTESTTVPLRASLRSGMSQKPDGFVLYTPSYEVNKDVEKIRIFIKTNLDLYKEGRPVLSPMELATVIQKWFVSVHPFADGNGRTSRAIQDVILANFDMPLVPGGDLQNDATEQYEKYIENTYKKTELILAKLEDCLDENRNARKFQCQTVQAIDMMTDTNTTMPKATRTLD